MTLERPVDSPAVNLLLEARQAAQSGDKTAASTAYRLAIRAVEQAVREIATPDNPTSDLGAIIAHYEERPDLWSEAAPRLSLLEPTMQSLAEVWNARPQQLDMFPLQLEDAHVAITVAEAAVSLVEQGYIELLDELSPEEEREDLAVALDSQTAFAAGASRRTSSWEGFVRRNWARERED